MFFLISSFSYKFGLIDIPNKRKKHLKPTAYTGGLALCLIYIISIFLFNFSSQKLDLILSLAFLIALVGLIDDKYNLNVGGKLSLQIIPIVYLIIPENINLIELGDYDYFKLKLNSFSIPFTLLSTIFLINSFNYLDGSDGTLGFLLISVIGILYFLSANEGPHLFLIIILIPILIFLCFNFSLFKLPKLFLGDSGSLLMGFIFSFTLIYFANQKIVHPILLAFSISIFVYEFLSINIIRLIWRKKIFSAGFDHLHHILLKKNKSLLLTNFFITFMNISFFACGYISYKYVNPLTSLIVFILCFLIFFIFRKKYYQDL
ncbi:undecaprenyl/decaprenyl-phosphate alpha-N-acetylglucosaminyl 1-phosphate transferase [Pelagibacterales bacterium SAG-MED49]|nr:undecaprenyl/decaprenyl-phosphate alpha-N-acetylglucosaminyl 1-phosphate transferase [Pelagibacterales bacterium SAG-MED49]